MRTGLVLAILIGTTAAAVAQGGPVLVIPGRPGVPIVINGVDASYAVVEGDWGLGKGWHVTPTVFGGHAYDPVPNVGHYYPSAGQQPGYGRLEIEPPANRKLPQPAESYHRLVVGAIQPAAAAARGSSLSAAGAARAAGRCRQPASGSGRPATGSSARKAAETSALDPPTRITPTGESNASDDFRIGSGVGRDDRGCCARDGMRRRPVPGLLAMRTGLRRAVRPASIYQPQAYVAAGAGLFRLQHRLRRLGL